MRGYVISFFIALFTITTTYLNSHADMKSNNSEQTVTVNNVIFYHKYSDVNGIKIHYVTNGEGKKAIFLLHGFPGSWLSWKSIMGKLAKQGYYVVVPDFRGAGDTSVSSGGYEKKNLAIDIHELAKTLKIEKSILIGHDIGTMIAYAYAEQFPHETDKIIIMDSFIPGIKGWEAGYNGDGLKLSKWHFRFHGEVAEKLVEGRERIYLDMFWKGFKFPQNPGVPLEDQNTLTEGYSRPGRMAAAFALYSSWLKDARDNKEFSKTPINTPILSIGGDKSRGETLGNQAKTIGTNVKVAIIKDCGHFPIEEKPQETEKLIFDFLK